MRQEPKHLADKRYFVIIADGWRTTGRSLDERAARAGRVDLTLIGDCCESGWILRASIDAPRGTPLIRLELIAVKGHLRRVINSRVGQCRQRTALRRRLAL